MVMLARTREHINQYAQDKLWYWHVPLWVFGLYLFISLLRFDLTRPMPFVVMVPYAFDFMLHEMAHILTAWLPPLMTAAAGSFSELLLGAVLVYGAFQLRNYFASLFCCVWCMLAFQSVGAYMADAVPQRIPLVSLGGALAGSENTIHDWNFVFGRLHMLGSSGLIGGTIRVLGVLIGLFGVVFSAWIMYRMAAAASVVKRKAALAAKPAADTLYPVPTKGEFADPQQAKLGEGGNSESKDQKTGVV